jgi:predicted Fe-S protein YdhL (DUF1289 family)
MNSAAELVLEKAQTLRADRPVPSPCLSICRMDAVSEVCAGCFRTLDEIAGWGMMKDDEKRAVWTLIEQRARQA